MNAYVGLDIFLKCIQSSLYKQRMAALKRKYQLYYSSAHFDELLNINYSNIKNKIGILDSAIKTISVITDNNIITNGGISLQFENKPPLVALKKCINKEGVNLGVTEIAAISDKINNNNKSLPNDDIRVIKEPTDDMPDTEILKNEHFRGFIKSTIPFDLFFLIETQPKEQIKNLIDVNKNLREALFEIVFKALDVVNFCYNDPANKNFYEASHAMYASATCFFITNDENFHKRCSLVYKYLGVTTSFISSDIKLN